MQPSTFSVRAATRRPHAAPSILPPSSRRLAPVLRLRIGAELKDTALDDKQTGREMLELQARLYGLRVSIVKRRVEELIELVDIGEAIDRFIGTYSGGMERRRWCTTRRSSSWMSLPPDWTPISRVKVWEEARRVTQDLGIIIFLTTQ